MTVNPTPATPTVGATGNICSGTSFTLSATTSPGATIEWFTGSCGGSPVGSGLTLSVSPSTTTTYFARARDTTTGCTSAACASQTVNVTPTPTSPTAAGVDSILLFRHAPRVHHALGLRRLRRHAHLVRRLLRRRLAHRHGRLDHHRPTNLHHHLLRPQRKRLVLQPELRSATVTVNISPSLRSAPA